MDELNNQPPEEELKEELEESGATSRPEASELTPELKGTEEKPPEEPPLSETVEESKKALLELQKMELKGMGDVLTHLNALVARLETLTGDLSQNLDEVGQMKAELAEAIAEAQAERQTQEALTEVVKTEVKEQIPEKKKIRLW